MASKIRTIDHAIQSPSHGRKEPRPTKLFLAAPMMVLKKLKEWLQ
jgi:hypothetical protein